MDAQRRVDVAALHGLAQPQHRDDLTEALDAAFGKQPTGHWLKVLTGVLPIAPVFTVKQAFENPFLREIVMVNAVPHPGDPDMRLLSNPLKFDGARLAQRPCQPLILNCMQ